MAIHRRVPVPLESVTATFVSFDFSNDSNDHVAVLFPGWDQTDTPLVRIHSECLTGDVFASQRCDCHAQLHEAMELMTLQGGVLLYLRQEGRGIGLKAKLDAYDLQIREGLDTYEANLALGHAEDLRSYDVAVQMLKDLGVTKIRLLTNNPAKVESVRHGGIAVVETVRTAVHETSANRSYLAAKLQHGHILDEQD